MTEAQNISLALLNELRAKIVTGKSSAPIEKRRELVSMVQKSKRFAEEFIEWF